MTKHIKYFIVVICLTTFNAAGTVQFVDSYKKERGIFKTLTIPMAFDSDSILRRLPRISSDLIFRIDYVATTYNNSISDYQKYLNRKRWQTLSKLMKLPNDKTYNRKEFYQTSAKNKEEANKLFHGYIIYFGVDPKKAHARSFGSMNHLINNITEKNIDSYTKFSVNKSESIDSIYLGDISTAKKTGLEKRLVRNNHVIEWGYDSLGVDKKYYGAYYILTKVSAGIFTAFTALKNKDVINMLLRAKLTDKTLIVTDLTGSMYPYYSQLLVWHAIKLSQGKHYKHVFFNDGDNKPTALKKIGSTGGIYSTSTTNILEVYRTMEKCMQNGSGGDRPENNMEAVLAGLKRHKSTNKIIMLADNWALPRDIKLIHQIKKPISYVMCGSKLGLNKDYVKLSEFYNGSLITVEKSITQLKSKNKGRY
jgi:hypothetical protein